MLDSLATISNESERHKVTDHLKFTPRHHFPESVIELLVEKAQEDSRLSESLVVLLQHIDHPKAIEYVATEVAQIESQLEGNNGFSLQAMHIRDKWNPKHSWGSRLSDESRQAVLKLWEQNDEKCLKDSLLWTWVQMTDSLDELRDLPAEATVHERVVWRRAELGDHLVSESVLEFLSKTNCWFHVVPPIWSEIFTAQLDIALGTLGENSPNDFSGGFSNDHCMFSDVLRDIPQEDAAPLLSKHWNNLKYSSLFVQVALYIGDDTLLALAEQVIKDMPDGWEPFRHLSHTFGFGTIGLQDRLTDRKIDALLPYVKLISDMDLMDVAEWLSDRGRHDDYSKHLSGEIAKRVSAQQAEGDESYIVRISRIKFPSDVDLANQLSEIEEDDNRLWCWCHYFVERGDSPVRMRKVVQKWFDEKPSATRLNIVSSVVLQIGQRDDVNWLIECQAKYGDDTTERLVNEATFIVRRRTLS